MSEKAGMHKSYHRTNEWPSSGARLHPKDKVYGRREARRRAKAALQKEAKNDDKQQ